METIFSNRIQNVPRSFIRDILKVAVSDKVISFAGGLPNKALFPVEALKESTIKVFEKQGQSSLQYAASEGYQPLRAYISEWYKRINSLEVHEKNILITTGSQQGLDLLGKVFINEKDDVIIEKPGYLGAIQAFSMYAPHFNTVTLKDDGPDLTELQKILEQKSPRFFYIVPNFQNPSGISYSDEKRKEIADTIKNHNMFLVEDDPYGQLRFEGESHPGMAYYCPDQTIMLGTFSKTVVPSFRIGWMVAPDHIMEKVIVAKQAADLHTNSFSQMVLHEYLTNHHPENHIKKICDVYGKQCKAMVQAMVDYFPENVTFTRPKGGMFLWVTLPDKMSSLDLFNRAIKKNVAFVPGNPFYIDKKETSDMRLNFSCSNEEQIYTGIKTLSEAIKDSLK